MPVLLLVNLFWPADIISEKGLISALYDKSKKPLFYFRVPGLISETVLISARALMAKIRYMPIKRLFTFSVY